MDLFTCTGQQIKQFFLFSIVTKNFFHSAIFYIAFSTHAKFRKLEYKASFRKKVANYFTKKSMPGGGGERPERKKTVMRGIGKKVLYQHSSQLFQ